MYNRYIRNDRGTYTRIPEEERRRTSPISEEERRRVPPPDSPPPDINAPRHENHMPPPPSNTPPLPPPHGAQSPPNGTQSLPKEPENILQNLMEQFHLDHMDAGDLLLLGLLFLLLYDNAEEELLVALGLLLIL